MSELYEKSLLKLELDQKGMWFSYVGIQVDRNTERIDIAPAPGIFTHIDDIEYNLLAPLSAKAFVEEEKRKMIFLKPQRFADFTQEQWDTYFATETSSSFAAGAHADFRTIVPYARKAEEGHWNQSRLEKVKEHILRQFTEKE